MATKRQIRLALVEDSAAFIQVIKAILGDIPNAVLVGIACDAPDGIKLVHQTEPDILLLDLSLRKGTGLDVLRGMAAQTRRTAVVVVTNQPSIDLQEHCFGLGARAFLDKTTQLQELVGLLENPGRLTIPDGPATPAY